MKKHRFVAYLLMCVPLSLIVGCSGSHGVAVVSHGENILAVKEPIPEKVSHSVSPDVASALSSSTPAGDVPRSVVTPTLEKLSPVTSPDVSATVNGIKDKEIFAQSAVDTMLPWTLQDVFFDYDQMAIRPDAMSILEQNAQVLLKRYANREVLLQGHCDERGTEAYNLILGERRATAVKNYLVNLGVSASQLRVLSLGKSQPFCLERTLPCFRQNRRAHFVLK